MKEKNSFLKSAFLPVVLAVLSVASPILYYAARATWVFIDLTTNIEKFTFILLYVMIVNALVTGILCALRVWKVKEFYLKKAYPVLVVISFLLTSVLFVAAVIFAVSMLTSESSQVYQLYLKESLYDGAFFVFLPFAVLFYPLLSSKGKKISGAILLVFVALCVLFRLFPMSEYKITSTPTVINTGEEYSVVFTTNGEGTGYVEYTYEGKEYKVYDHQGGRMNTDSTIHSVNVPFEHLDNNSYKVGSMRTVEQYSYGSRTGKTAVSEEYTFTPVTGENMSLLVISDWHTYTSLAKKSISHLGEYDGVILLGDAVPGVDREQQVADNIVKFAGDVSGGTKPVLYVRGNHETRGVYAGKILDSLGLDEFYYTANMGDISFVVLDSGEDKDDAHPEYGGMTDYNTYRADMIKWLEGVETDNDKVISLSHSWKISDVEQELSDKGWDELSRLGVKLMISGHNHDCRLVGDSEDEREKQVMSSHPDITAYIDGGHMNDGEDYIASKITLNEKAIEIEACNSSGERVFEHSVKW